jgi:hypothetical protein
MLPVMTSPHKNSLIGVFMLDFSALVMDIAFAIPLVSANKAADDCTRKSRRFMMAHQRMQN